MTAATLRVVIGRGQGYARPHVFTINDVIEIECSQFRAIARVRNVEGDRIHVALDSGYLPWVDDPVSVRRSGEPPEANVDARIVHASGTTALLELLQITAAASSSQLLPVT